MPLVIALNRGRLLEQSLPLLAAAGIAPSEDPKGSRKLIFDAAAGGHKLVIMRGSDVPTYVAHGAADAGIVGKDTLLETGLSQGFYERLDLRIGRCRLVVAHPQGAPPPGERPGGGPLRVATKYVNSSRRFFERRGCHAAIIPLSGAMEIAPGMNLADCIVDIADTGRTLAANGLAEGEIIAQISARLIVNRASMKTKFDEIGGLVARLRRAVEAGR